VVSKLPERYQAGAPPIEFNTVSSSVVKQEQHPVEKRPDERPPQKSAEEFVEALYDYKPQQPEDLELCAGDKVRVIEHTSPDWWKGSCNGREGMFPSNYVKRLEIRSPSQQLPAPSYDQSQMQYSPSQQQLYNQGPQQQFQPQYNNQYPQQGYSAQPPYQQQQAAPPQQVVVQQEGHQDQSHLRKFGSKLGNAAIFGAGATIGSDIVNSIF
jgi:hypothetical protein